MSDATTLFGSFREYVAVDKSENDVVDVQFKINDPLEYS
jgi:hypothetical protein